MLSKIAFYIGGSVKLADKDRFIIWVVNSKKEIKNIIKIFEFYPPMTSRLKAQLLFLIACFQLENVDWYLNNRAHKDVLFKIKSSQLDYSYFNEWLSGFIEAEGYFSIRKLHNNHSFSIEQKDDKYILEYIKHHFKITNEIRSLNNQLFLIEVYRKSILLDVIKHFDLFPLLGDKQTSFNKFKHLF